MAQIILHNSGVEGGIFIGEKGIRSIPPFDHGVRQQLRGISQLLNAVEFIPSDEHQRELLELINRLTNVAVEQIEGIVGRLDDEQAIIYQHEDGGFTCGSTGKPPIPLVWPPPEIPTIDAVIAAGVLEREMIDFLSEAVEKNLDIIGLLEDPHGASKQLGLTISDKTTYDLNQLAPSNVGNWKEPVAREIVEFYHEVLKDGQHLEAWSLRPYDVAEKLGVKLSAEAAERLVAGTTWVGSAVAAIPLIVIHIVVNIVVQIATAKDVELLNLSVEDRSGAEKI